VSFGKEPIFGCDGIGFVSSRVPAVFDRATMGHRVNRPSASRSPATATANPYFFDRRHPAAWASASLQNHRSPFEGLILVRE